LICLIIFYFILTVSLASIQEGKQDLINKLNNQAAERIESHLLELDNLTKQPLYDDSFMAILLINAQNRTYQHQELMIQTLNKIMKSNTNMHAAFFFSVQGETLSHIISNGSALSPYRPAAESWFAQVIELRGKSLITDSIEIPDIYYTDPSDKYAFSVSRAMVDAASGRIVAVLSLFSSVRIMRDICLNTRIVEGERALIISDGLQVIYDTEEGHISQNLADTDLSFLIQDGSLTVDDSWDIDHAGFLMITRPIERAGWHMIRIIPKDELNKSTQLLERKSILVLFGFMLLFMIVAIMMSFEVTKPIKKLIQIMSLTEKGDLSVRFKPRYNDEIAQLGNSFNRMLNEINNLIANIYDIEKRKRETELHALQMQINPHFIYNTLESIRMMAKINNDEESSEMIFILSQLLRYSISTKDTFVPLNCEIANLRNYIKLQNMRFDNKFVLEVDIPHILENMMIIKQILQPIVENAVYHALEMSDESGYIIVRAYQEAGLVVLTIEDNGIGMTQENLDALCAKINSESEPGLELRGIGLKNINQRIKLIYGQSAGIQIISHEGRGTTVRLLLPGCAPEQKPGSNMEQSAYD
jgi:two-component system sensor histidine kinase YesM